MLPEIVEILTYILLILYSWLQEMFLMFVPRSYRYKEVEGETVLITGGGSGIGRLLAARFSRLGCQVIIWDVNERGNKETVETIQKKGGICYGYTCDVTKKDMVYETAKRVREEIGRVTILINNAGIVAGKKFLDCTDSKLEKTLQVNTLAHFWTCKAFLPEMISNNHGHLVTISSLAGFSGLNGLSDYCASKFATVGFHESLSLELKHDNITGVKTTLVCPFFVSTGLFHGIDTGYFSTLDPEYVADKIVASIRCNEELAIIPGYFSLLLAIKSIMPMPTGAILYEALKGYSAMDNFVGRAQKND